MKKIALVLCMVLMLNLFAMAGCQEAISKLELENYSDEVISYNLSLFNKGFETFVGKIIVEPTSTSKDDLELVIDNLDIIEEYSIESATLSSLTYKVKPKYNGEFSLYVQTKDGAIKSETKKFRATGGSNNPSVLYYINETQYCNDFEFTVKSVSNSKEYTFIEGFLEYSTEYNFLEVEFTVTNLTSTPKLLSASSFIAQNAAGQAYDYHTNINIYLDGSFGIIQEIGAGMTKTFKLVFETIGNSDDEEMKFCYKEELIIESRIFTFILKTKTI